MRFFASHRWIFLLFLGVASPATAEIQKIGTIEGITEYRLPNGLVVLLFPDTSKETVTVNLTVFVGSRHEGYGEAGMAHLLEHMVFKGTPTHKDIPKELKARGAQFNGTTWVDRTNYFETLPASDENLEWGIRFEADRFVNSLIRREDLLSEFSVVRNEFEMGENNPAMILYQRMVAAAYEWHNYGKSTIGNRSDIERVPIENLQAFYKKYYQPDNAMLVVAGKFDPKKALPLVEKYFGAIPRPTRKLSETYTEEPAQDGERQVTLRRVGDVARVSALYHIPAGPHPQFPALDVLSYILADEPSGRLYKALVETKKAARIDGEAMGVHDPGIILFGAEVRPEQSLDEAKSILLAEVEGIAKKPVTAEEVDRARRKILKNRELAADNSSRLAIELSEWAAQGDWRLYFLHRDRIEKVTPAEVQKAAEKYLSRNNRTLGIFVPTKSPERAPVPPTPSIATLLKDYKGRADVAQGEVFDPTPENIEKRTRRETLPSGVKVTLLPKKTRGESVFFRLTLRYGTKKSLQPVRQPADFLAELMAVGTTKLTRQQISDELDKYKAKLHAEGAPGTVTFNIQTKRANLPQVLELLRQILREPSLPESELTILANQQLAQLEEGRTEPMFLAQRFLQRRTSEYPKDDIRYVRTIDEEIADIKQLKAEQVREVYQKFLSGQHGELAITGDFDPEATLASVASMLADWTSAEPYERIDRPVEKLPAPGKETILTPDKANAIYVAAEIGQLRDSDPDYPALAIGNFILGGGALSSRIGNRLRQKDGVSYGAGSSFQADPLDPRSGLLIYAIANPKNITKVESGIREELDKFLKEGVTADELDRAKKGYLQQLKVQRANDAALNGTLSENTRVGRTMQFQADLEKRIAGLTVADVEAAVRKHLTGKLIIVAAGDFKESSDKGVAQ